MEDALKWWYDLMTITKIKKMEKYYPERVQLNFEDFEIENMYKNK